MTPRQIELARHALGLRPGCLRSRRNAYVSGPGCDGLADWEDMVELGFAWVLTSEALLPGYVMFRLTRAGAERALMHGDVLDPEDWG